MTIPLVIIGAGGHGREMVDLLRAVNAEGGRFDLLGVLDDGTPDLARLARLGVAHLGPVEQLAAMAEPTRYLLGLGSGTLRGTVDAWATSQGREPVTLVHPSANVGPDVELDEGAVVFGQVSVTTNVRLGRHTHLNVGSSVAHDCRVGDFVTVSPGARLSGSVTLGDGVTLGTNAVVLPGTRVGPGSVVGAGAVVTRDVPAGVTALGVPARVRDADAPADGQALLNRTLPR